MCVRNPDRSPVGINSCDTAQTPPGFLEIVSNDSSEYENRSTVKLAGRAQRIYWRLVKQGWQASSVLAIR